MTPADDLRSLVAHSLDAPPELYAVLPDLLVDLEDLGARATEVVSLLRQVPLPAGARVLDLGCGKGASALAVARELDAVVHGLDGMPAFVAHARERAAREGLVDRCTFAVGDVRDAVRNAEDHDVVMMLALGDLLGSLPETVQALVHCVRPGGYILLDDAYLAATPNGNDDDPGDHDDPSDHDDPACYDRETSVALIELAGARVLGELASDTDESRAWLATMTDRVLERATALAVVRPELGPLLAAFAERQRTETQALMGPLVGVTWLLQRGEPPA